MCKPIYMLFANNGKDAISFGAATSGSATHGFPTQSNIVVLQDFPVSYLLFGFGRKWENMKGPVKSTEVKAVDTRITDSFIEETVVFWSKCSGKTITTDDAKSIIENITGFVSVLSDWDRNCN